MRLSMLELLAYGPFRGLALDFSAPGIHVVLGRNEAGKSTTLRAITGLLYGIDRMTPDAHVHKPADLRIAGVIESATGERLRVVRRKGNTNTLLDDAGQPVDESRLKKLLGGVSQETFRHAFGLDHDTLEAGARALLEGKGDLGESLFDASVGGGGEVQRLLADLANEADRIYKPRASALPLNDALKSFAEAQKLVRERESRPEAFLEQERGLREATEERAARVASRAELVARRARIERAMRRAPLERRLERALAKRAELGALAAQIARVDGLRERFGAYERALEQRRSSAADGERLAERAAAAARRAGVDPGGDAEARCLDARKEARIHALLGDRATLRKSLEATDIEIVRLERELGRLVEVTGDERPEPADEHGGAFVEGLALALDRARSLGDIEDRVAAGRARLERERKELETKAASLGLFDGTLDELVALRLPAVASVERLDARASELARALSRLEERAADLEREAASIDKQTAAHTGDFAPPDAAALRSAREARDVAWRALREANDAAARHAAEIEVEGRLREADAIADRMIREADRVTTLARLRSEAETSARQREKLAEEKARALEDRAALDAELEGLFASAGIQPSGFAEMCQWLERHGRIAEAHGKLREAEAALLEEEAKAAAAKTALLTALGGAARPGEGAPRSLAELVATAARRLAEIEAARRAALAAARSIVEVRTKLDERVAVRTRDEAALAGVLSKLGELLGPIGVTADAPVEEVNRSIEALRELFDLETKRADAEARARLADADVRTFEADLSRAIAELAPDLASMELRDAAPAVFARSEATKESAQEIVTLEAQLEQQGELALDDAERALVADPDAARRVEQELTERIDELDRDVTRLTERVGALRNGLEQMRADSHAAEAAAAAQQHLARVREGAERWCRVKLASVLLSREIERYREENQAPLLASSSSLFARLTLDAFSGIKAGFDEKDRPCLRCVRADGTTEVDVAGLSDGTRDQLYLSLRLASLLRRADVAEPMPLVLDDVLIQLDDQRASAALAVLAEVSRRMQVLFFTHHARLVELARAAVPAGELVIHELSSAPATVELSALSGQRSAASAKLNAER